MWQKLDLVNKRFGKLVVTSFANMKDNRSYWNTLCDCGNSRIFMGKRLTSKAFTSCGKCVPRNQSKFKDLTGKKFNKLFIMHSIPEVGRSPEFYSCLCDCGKTVILPGHRVSSGGAKSCGCIRSNKLLDLTGKIFENLTIISRAPNENNEVTFKCLCICGVIKNFKSSSIRNGSIISCGCIKKELIDLNNDNYKMLIELILAEQVYETIYNDADITFEEFYKLCKQDCFYCGISYTKSNMKIADNIYKDKFYYNGLDRLDSKINHTKENCVTSCYLCNMAKNNQTLNEFNKQINGLIREKSYNKNIEKERERWKIKSDSFSLSFGRKDNISLIKHRYYNSYSDGNLTLDQFYILSQENCFYCNKSPSCKLNPRIVSGIPFIYNTIDAIDHKLSHNFDNCIPCCYYCNSGKSDYSLEEFFSWIKRLENKNKNLNILT